MSKLVKTKYYTMRVFEPMGVLPAEVHISCRICELPMLSGGSNSLTKESALSTIKYHLAVAHRIGVKGFHRNGMPIYK